MTMLHVALLNNRPILRSLLWMEFEMLISSCAHKIHVHKYTDTDTCNHNNGINKNKMFTLTKIEQTRGGLHKTFRKKINRGD